MVLYIAHLAFSKKYSVGIYITGKQELLIYCKMYTLQQNVISEIKVQCIYIRPDMFQLICRSSKIIDYSCFLQYWAHSSQVWSCSLEIQRFLLKSHLDILHKYLPKWVDVLCACSTTFSQATKRKIIYCCRQMTWEWDAEIVWHRYIHSLANRINYAWGYIFSQSELMLIWHHIVEKVMLVSMLLRSIKAAWKVHLVCVWCNSECLCVYEWINKVQQSHT